MGILSAPTDEFYGRYREFCSKAGCQPRMAMRRPVQAGVQACRSRNEKKPPATDFRPRAADLVLILAPGVRRSTARQVQLLEVAAEEVALAIHKEVDACAAVERRFRDHLRVRD